jgi:hypothetical protein
MGGAVFLLDSDLDCGACVFVNDGKYATATKFDKQRREVDAWGANGRSAFHSAAGSRCHVI